MVTALDHPSDLVKALEAGADDFLTKPVDDLVLIIRVKNLARLKLLTDEMLMRVSTEQQMGYPGMQGDAVNITGRNGRILMVEDREAAASSGRCSRTTTSSIWWTRPTPCSSRQAGISIYSS